MEIRETRTRRAAASAPVDVPRFVNWQQAITLKFQ